MSDISRPISNDPAELVAIAIAAHETGDTDLQTATLRNLREQFGIKLTFGMPRTECEADNAE